MAALLPAVLALRAPSAGWQSDLGLLRELGLVHAGTEGVPSSVLTQLLGSLPLGSRMERAGLAGALALGAAGALAFSSWCRLLEQRRASGLNPPLALLGSLLATLSPAVLGAARSPGNGALALALLLLGLHVASAGLAQPRTLPLLGVVLGLCFGESHQAALVLLLIVLADAVCEGTRSELPWGYLIAGFVLSAGTCLAVPWLRSWAPGGALELGWQALPPPLEPLWAPAAVADGWRDVVQRALLGLQQRLGSCGGALALLGLAAAVLQREQRRAALRWLLLALAGLLVQLSAGAAGSGVGWAALAASAGLLAFVPLALQVGLCWLWARPLPFARVAGVLALCSAGTLVLQPVQNVSARSAATTTAAELWLELALERLPARSVLLVESPTFAATLLSAQLGAGTRPDVLVVPLALLQRGGLSAELLQRVPELAPVLRQLAVQGWADEAALSRVAEQRPLFVELDPNWHPRLLAHLRPAGLWLAFGSREASSLERRDAVEESRFLLERLRAELEGVGALDATARAALSVPLRQRALVLAALGDYELAASMLGDLLVLEPRDPLALELIRRIERRDGRVALGGLLGRRER